MMKTSRLTTYWSAEEASTVIEFLDELREVLWAAHGPEIIEMYQSVAEKNAKEEAESNAEFDDKIEF